MSIEQTIKHVISNFFSVDEDLITSSSGVEKGDIPNWDSLGQLQLVLRLENEFGFKFSMAEMQSMNNFDSILYTVLSKVKSNQL